MKRRDFLTTGVGAGLSTFVPELASAAVPSCSGYWYYFDRNLSNAAHGAVGAFVGEYLAEVAFPPSGGWVVVSGAGNYDADDLPSECESKLAEYLDDGRRINCVAFRPGGSNRWVVVAERRIYARNIQSSCYDKLVERKDAGDEIYCVAFSPDDGWVLLTDRGQWRSGIPSECWTWIRDFANAGNLPEHVAFTPNGGYVVLARRSFKARNIPSECYDKISEWKQAGARITKVAFAPNGGWHASSNEPQTLAPPSSSSGLSAVRNLMTANAIPGLSVVVVKNDAVHREHYYGYVQRGSCLAVRSSTRFQAASVSKVIATCGALELIHQGFVNNLDTNVRSRLGVSIDGRTSENFSIRELVTHSAGINLTNGFPGYRRGLSTPDTEGIIDGSGNTSAIRKATASGSVAYSGGGFVLLQQLTENLTGQSYPTWMKNNILDPLGMSSSRFLLDPTWSDQNLAVGHDSKGYPIGRRRHMYPEYAAAGLYTTPLDLRRLMVALNNDGAGTGGQVWDAGDAAEMLTLQIEDWGLGIKLGSQGKSGSHYEHTGSNAGFRSYLWGNPVDRNGVAIMANWEDPGNVMSAIKNAYVNAYDL